MSSDMDKFCTLVIVAGAVVLLFMGYGEMTRLVSQKSQSVCGGSAAPLTADRARSAKRSFAASAVSKYAEDAAAQYLSLNDEWPNKTADEKTTHQEFKQDEASLRPSFGEWMASEEETAKYDSLSINPSAVLSKANQRAIGPEVVQQKPNYTKVLGLKNPMLSIYHNESKKEDVKFSKNCAMMNMSEAYASARMAVDSQGDLFAAEGEVPATR